MTTVQKKIQLSHLDRVVSELRKTVIAKRDKVVQERAKHVVPRMSDYAWVSLEQRLMDVVRTATGNTEIKIQLDLIDREKFGGDIALKVPSLLKQGGPKRFVAEFQPLISEALRSERLADLVQHFELKGMYINITLTNDWLLRSAEQVVSMRGCFGLNDSLAGKNIVVDYSSPNIAKVLHAGHIRSTITGEVLSDIYDACGATVFRVNHINDFGGFGFLLEGYRRFHDLMPEQYSDNDRLLEVYSLRRSLEKASTTPSENWAAEESERLSRYFPEVKDTGSAQSALESFAQASDVRFEKLENGDLEEVALWQKMVRLSLEDFSTFYRLLNIDIDFVIGESFYLQDGLNVVESAVEAGSAGLFAGEQVQTELDALEKSRASGEISDSEAEFRKQAILKDVGSTLVRLPTGERFVLLRSDGRSIYATRDIGAIARRNELFTPDLVVYVVGQEQRSHFERLFASAKEIGLVKNGLPELVHLYFGFYVDDATGKKLSSRDSVSNVMALLNQAEQYFLDRLSERTELDETERVKAAQELTIGSLVFNDLKQDIKGSVEIDVSNLKNTIQGFERSGGAYPVYAACRARSIMHRHGKPTLSVDEIGEFDLSDQEAKLLLMLQLVPLRVAEAGHLANPTLLIRHLMEIASQYNSYYSVAPVLTAGGVNQARLLITKAVQLALVNGLAICHIDTPKSI